MRVIGIILLLFASCEGPSQSYVIADRATYTAIAPEYVRYVRADPNLTDEQKQRREDTVDTWNRRITAAEENR